MARCYCRWRNVLICVCTPCICLLLLFIYILIVVCMTMNSLSTVNTEHFVALGSLRNKSFAPIPKIFWQLDPDRNAFWNQLQLTIDRKFNPILSPKSTKRKINEDSSHHGSLLRQSFAEVVDLDSTRRTFEMLPRQLQEFVGHMQIRDYPILLHPNAACGAGAKDEKEPPLLLLAIKTTELNFKNRQAIRKTWGKEGWVAGQRRNSSGGEKDGGYVRRIFLLGKENPQQLGVDLSNLLELESERYGDILQWDFYDTFFNLTLKDVLFWSWFSKFCNQTRFILKGDDDVFVNTPNMISYLQEQLRKPQADKAMRDFMVGDVIGAALPNRVNKSKYFIPETFYKGLYPTYAGGGGVVYSGQLVKRLHKISQRIHLFPIDDVFTGMCMVRLDAHPVHHPAFLTFDFPDKDGEKPCAYHTILLVHKRSPPELLELWADMKNKQTQCQHLAFRTEKKKETKAKL